MAVHSLTMALVADFRPAGVPLHTDGDMAQTVCPLLSRRCQLLICINPPGAAASILNWTVVPV